VPTLLRTPIVRIRVRGGSSEGSAPYPAEHWVQLRTTNPIVISSLKAGYEPDQLVVTLPGVIRTVTHCGSGPANPG
jgi:hypothetical protein